MIQISLHGIQRSVIVLLKNKTLIYVCAKKGEEPLGLWGKIREEGWTLMEEVCM